MAAPRADHCARFIRDHLPPEGLFAGAEWRTSPVPFALGEKITEELSSLGRVLLQFYRALNLLYHHSTQGRQPGWIAQWLDQGKPQTLISLQRDAALRHDLPRVLRPDLLLTETGLSLVELDSVPGGIGLTGWLNQVYEQYRQSVLTPPTPPPNPSPATLNPHPPQDPPALPAPILGGPTGMLEGYASIFGDATRVHIVVSHEAAMYRPEMQWLARQIDPSRLVIRDTQFSEFKPGDAVYRFFELFDLPQVDNAQTLFEAARSQIIRLTPPPKTFLEEKLMFALLWNRNLQSFWRQELGQGFFERLLGLVPRTWVLDPTPLPPHAAIPELDLTDWRQLTALSQRDRSLVLKISGYSERAWGARGVFLGHDLSQAEWTLAVNEALASFPRSPWILQRFHKPKTVPARWFDFARQLDQTMDGRVRLCPYYFVTGEREAARARLGGVLATICPADKKIIHGMREAILAPCQT